MNVRKIVNFITSFILLSACLPMLSMAEQAEQIDKNISSATKRAVVPTILVLGDSLSAAYNLNISEGWVALLADKLANRQAKQPKQTSISIKNTDYSHYHVINASISGATTAAGLNILPQLLLQHKPQIVLLELGANDGLQGKPIAYIQNNLDKLITLSQEEGADVVLLGIKLPPNYGTAYTKPFFEQYKTLAQMYDLTYLPFLLDGVAGDAQLMQNDRLHPNAKAQPLILNNVWKVLAPKLTGKNHL